MKIALPEIVYCDYMPAMLWNDGKEYNVEFCHAMYWVPTNTIYSTHRRYVWHEMLHWLICAINMPSIMHRMLDTITALCCAIYERVKI